MKRVAVAAVFVLTAIVLRRLRAPESVVLTKTSDVFVSTSSEAGVGLLRDSSRDRRSRERMAVILGTFPAGKKEVLRALRDGSVRGLERSCLLALGIHSPEGGREFARIGMPYAVEAAEGLVVYVLGPVEDPEARAELLRHLSDDPDAGARRAAALVLRDSVRYTEVREGLLARVGVEDDSEAAAEGAAALAAWARRAAREDAERSRIVDRTLDVAAARDELFRFRLLSPLGETAMTLGEASKVLQLLDSPDPDVRGFGADLLGRRLESQPDAVPRLVQALGGDTNELVRGTAALALGRANGNAEARAALLRSLSSDVDWRVRASAATALGSHHNPDSTEALRVASQSDSRLEVRQASVRALATK